MSVAVRDEPNAPGTLEAGRKRYRADVQGLRAVAVLAVIADHFAGWPKGGFVGVDVFFVISGYLITGLLVREFEARGTISFTHFYARRIRRILPVAMFVIGATVLATRVLAGIDRYHTTARDAIWAVLFGANWHFANVGTNYFAQSLAPSPLQHYWSLSVEEQFYLVWPWLLLILLLVGIRLRFWAHRHTRLVAGLAIVVIGTLSLIWAFKQAADSPTTAYFSTFVRAWELGVGAFVAIVSERGRPAGGRHASDAADVPRPWLTIRGAVGWLGITGIGVSTLVVPSSSGFPVAWELLPVLSTAAVLAVGGAGPVPELRPLTTRTAQYLGKISYSLYLWHFPVAVLIVTLVPQYSFLYWAVGLTLIFGLSVATFHLLEDPARRGEWFHRHPGRLPRPALGWFKYAGACAGLAIVALVAHVGVVQLQPSVLRLPGAVAVGRTEANPRDCFGAAVLDPTHHCVGLNRGDAVAPLPGELPDDTGNAYDCYAYAGQPAHPCIYGSRRPHAIRVALVGDSHAAALLPALEPQLQRLDWRLTAFTGNSCGWLPASAARVCRGMPTIEHDLERGRYQVVLTTEIRVSPSAPPLHVRAMAPVAATGAHIVVIEDDPDVSPAAAACVTRVTYTPTSGCGTPISEAYRNPDRLAVAARQVHGAHVVHTERFYCHAGLCPETIGNVLVYRDTAGHVTASYAQTLSPYLVGAILRALPAHLR